MHNITDIDVQEGTKQAWHARGGGAEWPPIGGRRRERRAAVGLQQPQGLDALPARDLVHLAQPRVVDIVRVLATLIPHLRRQARGSLRADACGRAPTTWLV